MDNDQRPALNQLNLIVRNWDATLAFYRLLGLEVDPGGQFGADNAGRHTEVDLTSAAMTVEFDNAASLRLFAPDAANVKTPIIGFAYPSAEAVDASVARVTAAGHTVHQRPYDAFWGARYAIVQDPDGTTIGLMGPIDRSRGYAPGGPPPA